MGRIILQGLQPFEYEHRFDRMALEQLKKAKGFDTLVKAFYKHWAERLYKMQFAGSYLQVDKDNFPRIHRMLLNSCRIMEMEKIPALYIKYDYSVNAFVAGIEEPALVFHSGCLDLLTDDELMYLFGHELGHIKSNHMLYRQISMVLPEIGKRLGYVTFGVGELAAQAITLALLHWYRMSEFTADRAGLLTAQNIDASTTTLMKIAGLPERFYDKVNVESFKRQAQAFEDYDYERMDKAAKLFSVMGNTHPWTVMRAKELFNWQTEGGYAATLNRYMDNTIMIICHKCDTTLKLPKRHKSVKVTCPKCQHSFIMQA
ncbi:M48 family metalloprotease [Anoxynatronum sibiricum]|uniref:M48 family metalloprotease n=1 Tax=Anoxynatronum sibiricum TaxID=210623 RepID=A0ABU9VSV6_9CLOT